MVIVETLGWKKKDEVYTAIGKFFGKILGLIFAVGVASGIVMEFQFGTNWAASADAKMCSALYELNTYSKEQANKYKEAADKILKSLSTPKYRANINSNDIFIIKHCV